MLRQVEDGAKITETSEQRAARYLHQVITLGMQGANMIGVGNGIELPIVDAIRVYVRYDMRKNGRMFTEQHIWRQAQRLDNWVSSGEIVLKRQQLTLGLRRALWSAIIDQ